MARWTICAFALVASVQGANICPSVGAANTDCGYIITINPNGSISGVVVPKSAPYDNADDVLVGVINNGSSVYTGSFTISGSGNGGGLFAFDGDGICTYAGAAYCTSAATQYEGPLTTFSNIKNSGSTGTVNIANLAAGATTYFSLEGAPASLVPPPIIIPGTPEPGTLVMLATGCLVFACIRRGPAMWRARLCVSRRDSSRRMAALVKPTALLLICLLIPGRTLTAQDNATVREGDEVKLKFSEPVSSKTARPGDQVTLELAQDLRVHDVLVAREGSKALAEVTSARKAGMMGKGGDLAVQFLHLKVGDNRLKLRGTKGKEGDSKTGTAIALTFAFGIVGLMKHGKNAEVPAGTLITAYIAEDTVLPVLRAQ